MRKLILGLIVATAAVSTAEAKGSPQGAPPKACKVQGSMIRLVESATFRTESGETFHAYGIEVARPDLVGQRFRVVRYAEHPRFDAIEIAGKAGTFYVRRSETGGAPGVSTDSWKKGEKAEGPEIDWGKAKPRMYVIGDNFGYVEQGPLSALRLIMTRCR